jgi:methylenetetrahydrofolate reductase (NADPH)
VSTDIAALLSSVTFDLSPAGAFEEALAPLPEGARVAVALDPEPGVWATVESAALAVERGYQVVPHVAPRFIEDRDELDAVAGRLAELGITDIFVPGGDREEPVGTLDSAHEMLVALEELGYAFPEIGVTGYPTGHPSLEETTLFEALSRKAPHATYVTTQLCFDAEAILSWTQRVRDRGVDLPIEAGVAGAVGHRELLSVARQWGVAGPLGFARQTTGVAGFLWAMLVDTRYDPGEMVEALTPHHDDPESNLRRLRLYTLNRTDATESWRREHITGGG